MNKLLIIFVKNPELGKVKTRLARTLGDEKALAVYFKLLTKTREVASEVEADKVVYYSSYVDTEDGWNSQLYQKKLQRGEDLGERMHHAFEDAFARGYKYVTLIGSDIYDLTPKTIESAFEKLQSHDVVLGPAKDGGYYLIGLRKSNASLFELRRWSTPNVFSETVKIIEKQHLTFAQTRLLNDIDEVEDLEGTGLI